MPEELNSIKYFTLLEALSSIQKTLLGRYTSSFWVKAEIMKLNHYVHSGHAYPDLVEKIENKIVAQTRALIWRDDFNRINNKFLSITKEPIKDGITTLLHCRISFDALYGLSLRILDIDPLFTLGELEKERQETIKKIKDEGIWDKNRKLSMPILPKRLAIISVETSKGYSDFINIIKKEEPQYKIFTHLFPSLLQGDNAVESMIMSLDTIEIVKDHFDAVLIIRGGGGDIGLSCYNNYDLVKRIAVFPLPILTGIGHSTNETVAEMVSNKTAITPTDLADYIISSFRVFDQSLKEINQKIINSAIKRIERETQTLTHFDKILQILDPKNLLKRGYSITYIDNKIIKTALEAEKGEKLITLFADGKIISRVEETEKTNKI
ncbi:MAG: exodeoxyribonuclease VII large subunit [Bacteroidales bacterium]|nr:exodeoxyribonuclease VII large subunit [Bacteroidales bacterium]